jgi:hypothetical protein
VRPPLRIPIKILSGLLKPETREKVLETNYERLFDAARAKVCQHLRLQLNYGYTHVEDGPQNGNLHLVQARLDVSL